MIHAPGTVNRRSTLLTIARRWDERESGFLNRCELRKKFLCIAQAVCTRINLHYQVIFPVLLLIGKKIVDSDSLILPCTKCQGETWMLRPYMPALMLDPLEESAPRPG